MSFRRAMSSGFSSCCRATSDGLFKAGEEFEDDLGIELSREGPAALGH
jgi:hypothetical protein